MGQGVSAMMGVRAFQRSSWEQERQKGLVLSALSRLDGGDRLHGGDDEALESLRCLWRDRPSRPAPDASPGGLRDLEHRSACFEPALHWAHDVSWSPEGPNCCSASGPVFLGTEGPTVGWGGAAPNMFCILAMNASCHSSIKACTPGSATCAGETALRDAVVNVEAGEAAGTWVTVAEGPVGGGPKAKPGCDWEKVASYDPGRNTGCGRGFARPSAPALS